MSTPVLSRAVTTWLWICILFVLSMVVVGGITRLTGSGLSITRWDLIKGILPPSTPEAWEEAFALYKQIPQYQQINPDMTLSGFKVIFFWEWFHRLLGRVTGLVFVIPAVFFWRKGMLPAPWTTRVVVMIGLIVLQGMLGWFMVMSGLADRVYVSHFRLAAHLSTALLLLGYLTWMVRVEIRPPASEGFNKAAKATGPWLHAFSLLLVIQIVWGAFTAGLKAGLYFPTFPAMNGAWIPAGIFPMEPAWLSMFWDPRTIHWFHRILGFFMLFFLTLLAVKAWKFRNEASSLARAVFSLMIAVLAQVLIAWVMVVKLVPVFWGTLHQFVAALVVMATVTSILAARKSAVE
jgi:cytochrome c oxidase assembly protein subunit 15